MPPDLPDPSDYQTFAEALDQFIEGTGMSPYDIAAKTGVSRSEFIGWTKGAIPRIDSFNRFFGKAHRIDRGRRASALSEAYTRLRHGYEGKSRKSITNKVTGAVQTFRLVTPAPRPPPKQSGPGPRLRPTTAGFDIQGRAPPNPERTNPGQVALYNRLKRHTARLESAIARISNTHKILADEFADYTLFLSADLAGLDVASLWSVGTGLSEQVSALSQAGRGVMTPELEPDILAEFRGLLMDHTAFIQGFAVGRELHERVLRTREAAQANPDLQAQSASVLRPMTSIPKLLAVKARHMVEALTRALASTPHAAFDLLASSGEVARNSIVAFARVLHPVLIGAEATNLALLFAGHEHAEVLQAAAIYFRDNIPHVVALFANDPQLAEWLAWMVLKVRDLEI